MKQYLMEAAIVLGVMGAVAFIVTFNPWKHEQPPPIPMVELKAEPRSGLRQICVPSPMDHNTEICGPVEVIHLKERFAYSFTDKATIECAKGMECSAIVDVLLPRLPAK